MEGFDARILTLEHIEEVPLVEGSHTRFLSLEHIEEQRPWWMFPTLGFCLWNTLKNSAPGGVCERAILTGIAYELHKVTIC